ncbi:glycosyltransferase family 2 protein [Candidatus Woesearchaeota archaeon]|nr:glycosyltransferase family 2 protein [Candidatus Woesearchaeota archaeon]
MVSVSVIVPLYNEERRSTGFLASLLAFCRKGLKDYEIILVNDGSVDNTLAILSNLAKLDKRVRVVSYVQNRGKGHAVREGVFASKGEKVLFIDADGSIVPDEIPAMLKNLDDYDVVVGTRASAQSNVTQPFLRKFIGTSFNRYVNLLYRINVRDTLCGFKGFRRNAAMALFRNLISERWVFDVELFFRIRKMNLRLCQQPITWVHKAGSRFKVYDPAKMALELLKLRIQLMFSS